MAKGDKEAGAKAKDEKPKEAGKKDDKESDTSPKQPVLPPLQAASRRLEKLLGGGREDGPDDKKGKQMMHVYSNPGKVVRRWLGTASGAAQKATLETIREAAEVLLDPEGPSAAGRHFLVEKLPAPTPSTEASMDVDGAEKDKPEQASADGEAAPLGFLTEASAREVESWLISLAVRILWRDTKLDQALEMAEEGIRILLQHIHVATSKFTSMTGLSPLSLYPILARLYRYRSLVAEAMKDSVLDAKLRKDIIQAHNSASLRRDADTEATLLNLLLHDLLLKSQVEQAQKLLLHSTFPESASNNQLCRFLYYSGRIYALRLDYTKAFSKLTECLRKSPTNTGLGFRITAQSLLVVVQLLMGEIPDRKVFFTKGMQKELHPYLTITQAVRRGDLAVFTKVVAENATRLREDRTYTLISRLAQQVVKAGLRKLHISYSRLSLQDVADRLGLPSATSAEFVVAKAVRDGVLDATIHHKEGYVQSHDLVDVYATKEPAEAFHRRIAYCLTLHNDAVRGMKYPPDAYRKQLEASRGNRRKRNDNKTDEEKAQELEDELDEDY